MKCNVGGIDRKLRIIAGIVIIAVGIYFQSWWGVIGMIPILTGVTGWCPAYLPFGLSKRNEFFHAENKSTVE